MEERSAEKLDLRQRKTRRQLTQALVELMEARPFQELSVTDICRQAMVHRTTFYAHFTDKQELLHYLMSQVEQECIAACVPPPVWRAGRTPRPAGWRKPPPRSCAAG